MRFNKTLRNIVLAGAVIAVGIGGLAGCGEKEEKSKYTGHYTDIDVNGDSEFDYTVASCKPKEGTNGTASMRVSRIEEDPRAMVAYHKVDYADVNSLRKQMEEQ